MAASTAVPPSFKTFLEKYQGINNICTVNYVNIGDIVYNKKLTLYNENTPLVYLAISAHGAASVATAAF